MMFSKFKPAAPGDNRPRCQYELKRGGLPDKCGRLARLYNVTFGKQVVASMTLCPNHQAKVSAIPSLSIVRVDRRKKVA